jgi:hypothetical protein
VETEPLRVAVLGSCISRDAFNSKFNPDYKRTWSCTLIQNQSSVISLMSEPLTLEESDYGEASDYDKWNVRTDTNKEFLRRVVEERPDYLVIDFFGDVHFGVLELEDGRFITNNRWKLWPTPYYARLKEAGALHPLRIEKDTERYLELWRASFDRLVAYLREQLPDTTFVLHRGHNTNRLWLEDEQRAVTLTKHRRLWRIDVPRLNELWSRLDDYAASSTGFPVIDLLDTRYPSFLNHPWGPFYVHYTLDYYSDFLAELNHIHLTRTLRSEGREREALMLEQMRSAARTRRDVDVARHEARIGRLQRRLARLEPGAGTAGASDDGPAGTAVAPFRRRVRRVAGRISGRIRPDHREAPR